MSGASISSDRQRTPEIESRWVLRWLAAIIGSWLLLWLLSSYRDRGPDVPTDLAEKSGFNAAQAEVWLREVFEPEEPHPSGSAANLRVRERIASLVARWGLEVVRQETELARRPGEPAFPLCNLMFRITGSAASDSAVLVLAVYY